MADGLLYGNNTVRTSKQNNDHVLLSEPLGVPGVARQLTAGSASANTALTTTCRRISIYCRTAAARFKVGSSSQTASATSHYIARDERIDIAVPETPNIALIRADTTDANIEITEYL